MPRIGWEILGQALVPLLPQCVLRTCAKISHEREPSLCSSRLWNAKSLLPGPCGGTLRQRQVAWQAPGCGLGRAVHVQVTAWSSGLLHCHAYSSTASIRPRALSSHPTHPPPNPAHPLLLPPSAWSVGSGTTHFPKLPSLPETPFLPFSNGQPQILLRHGFSRVLPVSIPVCVGHQTELPHPQGLP